MAVPAALRERPEPDLRRTQKYIISPPLANKNFFRLDR